MSMVSSAFTPAAESALLYAPGAVSTERVEQLLESEGLVVVRAGDAVALREAIREKPVVLVIVERVASGFAQRLLAELGARERNLSVLVFADAWDYAAARDCLGLGAFAYVDTNATAAELAGVLREARAARRATDERRSTDALDALGLATGGIAHDLNNAVTAVLGNVEIMREMVETDVAGDAMAQWVRCFDSIDAVSNRIALLAKQLMHLGQSSGGRAEVVSGGEVVLRLCRALRTARFGKLEPSIEPPAGRTALFRVDADSLVGFLATLVLSVREAFEGNVSVRLAAGAHDTPGPGRPTGLGPGRFGEITIDVGGVTLGEGSLREVFRVGELETVPHHRNVLTFPAAFTLVRRLGGTLTVERRLEHLVFRVYLPVLADENDPMPPAHAS